jgi:DnaK suppressor protein
MRKTEVAKRQKMFEAQRLLILEGAGKNLENLLARPEDKDEVDQANAYIEQSRTMQWNEKTRRQLQSIERVLQKIQNSTYELCDSCEEKIETRRLDANPLTTLCINCQEELDHQHRVMRGARGKLPLVH